MGIINLMKKDILVCKKYYLLSVIYIIMFAGLFSEYGMISFIMCAIGVHYVIVILVWPLMINIKQI